MTQTTELRQSTEHRLLRGWFETGGPADLTEHLRRYGPAPLPSERGARQARAALLQTVEQAGLTGRGGAAFPTGRKLRAVAEGAVALWWSSTAWRASPPAARTRRCSTWLRTWSWTAQRWPPPPSTPR